MEGEIAKDSQDGQVISSSGSSRLLRYVKNIGRFVLSQYITIGFGISCLLAYYFPCKFLADAAMYPFTYHPLFLLT